MVKNICAYLLLKMNLLKFSFFACIMYSILSATQYMEKPLPDVPVVKPDKQDNEKCVTDTTSLNSQFQEKDRLYGFASSNKKAPTSISVSVGTNFTYDCCGTNHSRKIYHFGLFKKGSVSPSTFICRVEVENGGYCSVQWNSNISYKQIYYSRMTIEYNKSRGCVLWTIHNATEEDEKTYVATVKDIFSLGQGSELCQPIKLNVTKTEDAISPIPTRGHHSVQTSGTPSLDTTKKETPSPMGPFLPTTVPKVMTKATREDSNIPWWVILIIVIAFVLILIATYICWRKPHLFKKVMSICHADEEHILTDKENEGLDNSNDSLLMEEKT